MFNATYFITGRAVQFVAEVGSDESFNEVVKKVKSYIEENFDKVTEDGEVDCLYEELLLWCDDEELIDKFFVSGNGVKCWDIGYDCVSFIIMENEIPTVDNIR